jgi:hypothetical protein
MISRKRDPALGLATATGAMTWLRHHRDPDPRYTITAEPLPDNLRHALESITSSSRLAH